MNFFNLKFGIFLLMSFYSFSSFAHHPGHQSSSSNQSGIYYHQLNVLNNQSATTFNLGFRSDRLDGDLGYKQTYQFGFEYAFNDKISAGLHLPIISYERSNQPRNTSFGDLGVFGKYQLIENKDKKLNFGFSLNFTLPTGNHHNDIGSHGVGITPGFFLTKEFNDFYFYSGFSLGFYFLKGEDSNHGFYQLGLGLPLVKKDQFLDLVLSLEGQTYFNDDSFQTGSTKFFFSPGIILRPTNNLQLFVYGSINLVDELNLKEGVVVTNNSSEVLADLDHSFGFNLSYFFN